MILINVGKPSLHHPVKSRIMTLKPLGHEELSDMEIVQRCADPHRELVGTLENVVKLSNDVVVKFGWNVSVEEACNQRRAFELLDRNIVRIPRVYRHFTQSNGDGWPDSGYLVMEYIPGKVLGEDEIPSNEQVERIAHILQYFSTILGDRPGPLEGGASRGLLWEENGKPVFKNVQQMERWLNLRLPDVDAKLSLEKYPLVLCHLDLAPRNIVWLADGSVSLLDWCSAGGLTINSDSVLPYWYLLLEYIKADWALCIGFYPRFFEVCMLKIMECSHGSYELDLIERMGKLTEDEENQMKLLQRSFYNGIKY